MPRGVPNKKQFENPIKFSTTIDETTKVNLNLIAGDLIKEYGGAIPTQGQVVDYIAKYFLEKNNE